MEDNKKPVASSASGNGVSPTSRSYDTAYANKFYDGMVKRGGLSEGKRQEFMEKISSPEYANRFYDGMVQRGGLSEGKRQEFMEKLYGRSMAFSLPPVRTDIGGGKTDFSFMRDNVTPRTEAERSRDAEEMFGRPQPKPSAKEKMLAAQEAYDAAREEADRRRREGMAASDEEAVERFNKARSGVQESPQEIQERKARQKAADEEAARYTSEFVEPARKEFKKALGQYYVVRAADMYLMVRAAEERYADSLVKQYGVRRGLPHVLPYDERREHDPEFQKRIREAARGMSDEDARSIYAGKDYYKTAYDNYRKGKRINDLDEDASAWSRFWSGVGTAFDGGRDLYTLGIGSIADAWKAKNAFDRMQEGQGTEADRILVNSLLDRMTAEELYDPGIAGQIGQGAYESLKFMLDMALTGGIGGAAIKGGKALVSAIAKKSGKEIGKEAVETAAKSGAKQFARQIGKDVAKSAVGSTVSPMVYNETLRRQNENYLFGRDENGEVTVRKTADPESLAESFAQALLSNNISRLVERGVGPVMEKGVQAIAKPLAKITPEWLKFGNNFLSNLGKNVKDWMSVQGFLPEAAEEFVEEILTRALVNQTAREKELGVGKWDDLFSPEWCKVTVGSVAVIQAAMGLPGFAASTSNAAGNSARMRKYMRNLPDNLREEVGRIASMEDDNQRAQALSEVLKRSTDLQRRDILGYITARAANNLGLSFRRAEAQQQETEAYRQTLMTAAMDGGNLLIATDRNGNRFVVKPTDGQDTWSVAYPIEGNAEDGTLQIGKPRQMDMGAIDMRNAQEYTVSELLESLSNRQKAQDEAQDTAIEQQERQAARPDADASKAYVAGHEFNYTDPKGNLKTVARGSRIVPIATVPAGADPNTMVQFAITKPGSSVSSPGVMLLSDFQNMMEQGYIAAEEQTESDTAADVQTDEDGNHVTEEPAQPQAEAEAGVAENGVENAENEILPQEEADETAVEAEIQPIGKGVFGNIYDQFKGKVTEAVRFLLRNKSGDLLGVFHREGVGDIDLVWGDKSKEQGFEHIIDKHVNELQDFATPEEAAEKIEDVINNGTIVKEKWDKTVFEKDGYKVVVRKNVRDENGKVIDDKNWVVTAFDNNKTEKEKSSSATTRATPDSDYGSRAVASGEDSEDKGTQVQSEKQVRLPENPVAAQWNALVDDNEGDEAEALDTAVQMVGNKTAELEKARNEKTTGKTVEAIQAAKRAKREKVSALETELRFWQDVAGYPEKKRAMAEAARKQQKKIEAQQRAAQARKNNPMRLRLLDRDQALGEPLSLKEYVLRRIATGATKFLWNGTSQGTGGLKDYGGRRQNMLQYVDNKLGKVPEVVADDMLQDLTDNNPELVNNITASDILSVIQGIGVGEKSYLELMAEAEEMHNKPTESEQRAMDEAKAAYEAAAQDTGTAPVETETQDEKPRFAGEVFSDEDWMRRDDTEEVPFQRTDGADMSPKATERQAKAIARQLKKLGLKGKVRIVDGVGELVKEARARLQSVFHGSPHGFKAFDFSHMGSGEGLQAYGWGGYVTEVEKIGRTYAEALAEKDDKLRENKIINDLVRELLEHNSKEEALSYLQSLLNESWSDKKRIKAQIKILETGRFLKEPIRHLYHVEIPTEQDGNYLVWEEVIPNAVIDRIDDELYNVFGEDMVLRANTKYSQSGHQLYVKLTNAIGSDKAASDFLSSLGFIGVSYPAQYRSGGRADNARNYVIFKESDMKITDHIRYEQDGNGEIAGATLPNGDVLLNREAMRVDTPFHEFAHKLFTYAKNNRAASRLYDAIRRYAQAAPQSVKDYVSAHYPGLSEDAYLDEVFAWALSKQSEGGLEAFLKERGLLEDDAAKTWYGQVWDAIKALWAELRPMISKLMGRDFADLSVFDAYDEMGAEETGRALYDLMMGGKALPGAVETKSEATRSQQTDAGLSDEERGIVERAKADGTYLKAPNGQPTKLSPKQWAQVRTSAFKDWFGDWELPTKTVEIVNKDPKQGDIITEHGFKNFDEAREWAKKNIAGVVKHNEIGDINISNTSIEKYLSEKAVSKSDNEDVHKIALRLLPRIIENSIVGETHSDKKNSPDVRDIVLLYGCVDIEGNEYRVKTTVKRYNSENEKTKAYSYEITEIELLEGTPGDNRNPLPRSSNNSISAAKLLQGVKKSNSNEEILNASKVVDENGEPLVVYHGTEARFSIFRHNPEDIGFHFGNKKIAISRVGRGRNARHMQTYISVKKPLVIDTDLGSWSAAYLVEYLLEKGKITKQEAAEILIIDSKINSIDPSSITANNVRFISDTYRRGDSYANAKIRHWLRSKGYDGIKYSNYYESDGKDSWIVFSPSQIKSATDNVGTFDAGNADIRFRRDGFQNGINTDEVLDLLSEQSDYGAGGAVRLIQDLEEHFGGELESASSGARNALENGLVPFAGNKYAGTDSEYHHMAFVDENGDRKVESVPFTKPDNLKDVRPAVRFAGEMFEAPVPAPTSVSAAAKREAAEALSKRLGVPVVIEDKTTPKGRSRRFAGVKGWFVLPSAQNPNGVIHVNVDNHASVDDVERTMLHEVVAHMGMRKMMGEEKYNALLDKVYESMDAEARAYFEDYAAKDFKRREGMTEEAYRAELQRIAADEYIAALAEVGTDPTTWQKVVALVREALRALGFNLSLSEADIRALLYESKHSLESAAYYAEREMMRREQKEFRDEANLSNRLEEDEREMDGVRMRRAGTAYDPRLGVISIDADKMGRYDKWSRQGMYRRASAVARYFLDDSMPLRHLMTHIRRSAGGVVSSATDLWRQKTMVVSRARFRIDEYNRKIGEPLMESVRDIYRATKDKAAKYLGELAPEKKNKTYYIDLYLMAKHMPERNAWMAANRDSGKSDYAGAEGFKEKTGMTPEEYVARFEKMIADAGMDARLNDMWRLINESTDFSLRQRVDDGLLGKDKYDEIMARGWTHYVPLRSWDTKNAQSGDFADMEYPQQVDSMNDTFTNNVKRAEGRRSLADSPLAYIFRDAETSVTLGETNRYRQAVAKLRDDNKNMTYIFGTPAFLEGKETEREEQSHFVTYYENGKRKQVGFVNPMLAAALRGDRERKRSHWMRPMQVLTRIQSALNTSLNPAFALTNAARDIQFGIYSRFVESANPLEGFAASVMFIYELLRNLPAAVQASTKDGGMDGTGRNAQLIRAWRENGGETGWHTLNDLRQTKDKLYKGITSGKIKNGTKEVLYAIPATFRVLTEISENAVRLAAFSDAKRRGMSDAGAASYSKEITTNFNRHSQFAQDFGPLYMFLNAQTQGIYRFLTLTKENPGNTALAAIGMAAAGLFMSIGEALKSGGDDDDEKGDFLDRNEFLRFNNFIMGNFILPVAHNARMFYGIGAAVGDYIMGHSNENQLAYNLMQITGRELLPSTVNLTEWLGYDWASRGIEFDPNAFVSGVVPSALTPVVEAYTNRNFMGSPIYYEESVFRPYAPRVARSRKDVNPLLLKFTEWRAAMDGYDPEVNKKTGFRVDEKRTIRGRFDWNASALEHVLTSYAGGTGKFVNDTYKLVKKWEDGEEDVKPSDVPILKNFVRPIDPDAALNRTYNRLRGQRDLWEKVLNERFENISAVEKAAEKRHMSVEDYVEMQRSMARSGLRQFEEYEAAIKKLAEAQAKGGDKSEEVQAIRKRVMRMANAIENSALRELNAPQADRKALLEALRGADDGEKKRMIDAYWDILLRSGRTEKAAR